MKTNSTSIAFLIIALCFVGVFFIGIVAAIMVGNGLIVGQAPDIVYSKMMIQAASVLILVSGIVYFADGILSTARERSAVNFTMPRVMVGITIEINGLLTPRRQQMVWAA